MRLQRIMGVWYCEGKGNETENLIG
jgi:hypothetical protein